MERPGDDAALESEFRRIGTSAYEAFRYLSNLNAPHESPIPAGAPVSVSFDLPKTLQVFRSLPDRAGVQAFIDRFVKEFAPRRPGPPKDDSGAPGA